MPARDTSPHSACANAALDRPDTQSDAQPNQTPPGAAPVSSARPTPTARRARAADTADTGQPRELPTAAFAEAFASALLDWFAVHKRPLPWRFGYEPYSVWISEVMLQQTQMDRGVDYFLRWMTQFPDVASVAAASEDELLKAWEGLGYYSRVRNLHKAAKALVERHGGELPDDPEAIRALPGIGPYTAGAIAGIAFNRDVTCIDANVDRVFSRVFDIDTPVRARPAAARIRALATALLPAGRARDFNQALMELGALVCRKKPQCASCPLSGLCESLRLGIPHERPVPGRKQPIVPLDVATGVLVHGNRIFIQKRPEEGVWAGFWEFPGGRVEKDEAPDATIVREYAEETAFRIAVRDKLAVIRHGYTTYRVALHCYLCELDGDMAGEPPVPPVLDAATEYRWVEFAELPRFTFPAGHRKLIDQLTTDLRFAPYR
uniref:Adenine DNA glycosylase n=2 Tax=Nitratidesulfovibrio vulgaris TaxID=881 RepID=B8DQ00_NITV9|nr:A/G-specific adenine glycosylase [Desulfovibrio vulgaris] [Nitratidesulfovibrio vulgaris str. 'Miyazaki F']